MPEPRKRPPQPLMWIIPLLGMLVVGGVIQMTAVREPRRDFSIAGPLPAEMTVREERHWVDAVFPPTMLPAPLPPLPCRGTGGSWRAPLIQSRDLIRGGNDRQAEVVINGYLQTKEGHDLIDALAAQVAAMRRGDPPPDSARIPTVDVLGALHLLHTSAYLRLKRNATADSLFWHALRRPIGYVALLSKRGEVGEVPGDYPWTRITIPSPGSPNCSPTPDDLTTHHLYNNLILVYLRNSSPGDSVAAASTNEYNRPYENDPLESNPLLPVLIRQRSEEPRPPEGWRRVVSNAEPILRELTWNRSPDMLDMPAWLGVNLAQVLDTVARVESDSAIRQALLNQRDVVAAAAARARPDSLVEGDALLQAHARLLLLRAIHRGDPPELPAEWRQRLGGRDSTIRAVDAAVRLRSNADSLAALLARGEAGESQDLVRASWLAAARHDLASEYVRRAAGKTLPRERSAWEKQARGVLERGDDAPEELKDLWADDRFQGIWQRLRPLWPLLGATAAFPALLYLAWVLERRRAVWVSYYRIEARQRVRDGL